MIELVIESIQDQSLINEQKIAGKSDLTAVILPDSGFGVHARQQLKAILIRGYYGTENR